MEKPNKLFRATVWELCAYNSNKECLRTKKISNRAVHTSVQLTIIAENVADKNRKGEKNNGK